MNNTAAIQQIVDKISSSSNVLIAVSDNPSLDALSAAISMALLLNKLDKHATAVFSGKVPPSITFLHPEKTFEPNTNSLRDFIISLDKEKADHLRYKIEGDFVRIYITPYRTTITKDDLEFTIGDLNMDLVIALGVYDNKHLDNALFVHGRVLHDSTIISLSKGEPASKIGTIEWHEPDVSSLCEMVEAIVEPFNAQKKIMDKQIATALLTGIVAETDRFSNEKTNSNSMTVAAKLMAAGANQQLIAAKLSADHPTVQPAEVTVDMSKINGVDKASVEQFIVEHKDDTLEEITKTVKDKPSAAIFSNDIEAEPVIDVPAIEKDLNTPVEIMPVTSQPLDDSQPKVSAVVPDESANQHIVIEPSKDFLDSSAVNPPMNASMIPTPVTKTDIFEKPPSAFDSMVFNPTSSQPSAPIINPPSNVLPTAIPQTNTQAALAAVHASFDGVPSLPMPPTVPDISKPPVDPLNPTQNIAPNQSQLSKPQSNPDPTQFQIPV